MKPGVPALLALLLPLAACGEANMDDQAKARTWDKNEFFPKEMTMRHPVAGTVPRRDPAADEPQPALVTAALLDRGRERYGVFCTPCHGQDGRGGLIVARGMAPAGNLTADGVRRESAADLYAIITQGKKSMFGMGQMIPSADRWAIIAYLRALQLSQDAPVASLTEADRAALEATR